MHKGAACRQTSAAYSSLEPAVAFDKLTALDLRAARGDTQHDSAAVIQKWVSLLNSVEN